MSTEEKPDEQPQPEEPKQEFTTFEAAYAGPSTVTTTGASADVSLFANRRRSPVRLEGTLKDPLRFREGMSALYAIVGSDYRYVPKDRTAYMAYMRMRRETSGMALWQAQQAHFSWLLRNDPLAFLILDPIITVHPDQVLFEVFSKDEGTYAKLAIDRSAFAPLTLPSPPGGEGDKGKPSPLGGEGDKGKPSPLGGEGDKGKPSPLGGEGRVRGAGAPVFGTTNIDFSQALFDSIQQMRSYRETRFHIAPEGVEVQTTGGSQVLEKQVRVPDSWLRGFLQVQSAAALPTDKFSLRAIDLYNMLRQLRLHGDRKGQRRGLRIELVPGEPARLVLEPWETVLASSAGAYRGTVAKVVRVWGRRRLLLLRRLLSYVEQVDVHLLGSGLPSFWVLRTPDMSVTLGLTGFTASNWSQALSFDLLLPRKTQTSKPVESVLAHLAQVWFASAKDLGKATGLKGAALVEALQLGCQQGQLMYDLAADVYRLRPLTETPLDLGKLEYRNQRERTAHDLLGRRGAVRVASVNRIAGTGLELTGKVAVTEDKREYRPQMLLADEGQVSRAECTCPLFRKQGLKDGPCVHLIALRLAYADQEAKRLKGTDPREAVTVQTRTYSKRDAEGEDVMQLSLERQRLKIRWGRTGQALRLQTLKFNTLEEARAAFYARIDQLDATGYLDATAG